MITRGLLYVPKVLCSEGSMFRRCYVTKALWQQHYPYTRDYLVLPFNIYMSSIEQSLLKCGVGIPVGDSSSLSFFCGWHGLYGTLLTTLTLQAPNYSIWIFTHLKLYFADAIHNFKWVKIIQIWQNGGQLVSNIAGWCHILSLTYLECGT